MKILKNNSGQYSFSLWLGGRLTPVSAGKQVRIPDMDVADVRRQIEAFGFLSLEDAPVQREVPVTLPPVESVKPAPPSEPTEKLELLCTVAEPEVKEPVTEKPEKPPVKKAASSKTPQRGRPKKDSK
jgi:hypothetical protein